MLQQFSNILKKECPKLGINAQPVRWRYRLRGLVPGQARSLKQILEDINRVDPDLSKKIDIGLPPPPYKKEETARKNEFLRKQKNNSAIEMAARKMTLKINLDEVKKEWLATEAPDQIKAVAEHYGLFQDLFGDAYFTPYVSMDITYLQEDGMLAPVHRGNVLKPTEAGKSPRVSFSSSPEELWTLILTNPDGNLIDPSKEYVHWFVGNIPGGDVGKGEVVSNYLQPFPPRGVGFQRLVFVLYKQGKRVDYSSFLKKQSSSKIKDRTFDTFEFYREYQDLLTPSGLAFFQSDYDSSVKAFFHNILDMEEPNFEYDFPKPYVQPQRWFPKRKAFNMYLDKYRDPKDIAKDFLIKKLAKLDPFKAPKKPFPYPNVYKVDRTKVPTWLLTEQRRVKLGLGRINHQNDD